MKTRIVKFGRSSGIRVPKRLLDKTGLSGDVEIVAENGSLVIRSAKNPRAGWSEAFQEMARKGDDALLADVVGLSRFDEEEWEWQ
jgi:antitoxin MazE